MDNAKNILLYSKTLGNSFCDIKCEIFVSTIMNIFLHELLSASLNLEGLKLLFML